MKKDLLISNMEQEQKFQIYGYSSGSDGGFLIDDHGDEYRAQQVRTSKTEGRSYISVFFPTEVPLRVTLAFIPQDNSFSSNKMSRDTGIRTGIGHISRKGTGYSSPNC